MITCIIIDDEKKSRELLHVMLRDYCQGVRVIGESGKIEESLDMIRESRPQLVLLDIRLSGSTAFELLDAFPDRSFEVIFTTGHDEYALKAIKYAGTDYLLKPIDLGELKDAIQRVSKKVNTPVPQAGGSPQRPRSNAHTVVPTNAGYMILDTRLVVYLQADGAYTRFFMDDGSDLLVCDPIGVYEKRLSPDSFVRIHRSHIVNLHFVREYVRGRGGYVRLKNGSHLDVSARKKNTLLQALGM